MPLSIPFTLTSTLSFSPDGVADQSPRALSVSGNFDQKDDDQYQVTGSGSLSITLKGPAKVLRIKVDANATGALVNVTVNGGADNIEISPGGHLELHNPVPSVGITSLAIAYTTDNLITVIALS